jgi:hypothetical protein
MRSVVLNSLAAVVLATPLWAFDEPQDKADKSTTPRQRYEALTADYQAAQQEVFTAMMAAKTE